MKEPSARQGVALVLVLGALLLVVTAITAAIAIQGDSRRAAILDSQEWQAQVLADDAEVLARTWLAEYGGAFRSPSDDPGRGQVLLDDASTLDGMPVRLRVVVWDALSGVPAAYARRGAVLYQELPPAWRELDLPPPEPQPRADEVSVLLEAVDLPSGLPRYPPCPDAGPQPAADRTLPLALAISAWSDGRVNILTAPPGLIAAVARQLGRPVDLARVAKTRADPRLDPPPLPQPADLGALRLVAGTDRWQLRTEIEIGAQCFAWWTVIAADAAAGLERLQRHALTDP